MDSYKELQKRCFDLGLYPCHGPKSLLRKKIQDYENKIEFSSPWEEELYNHDPILYDSIADLVPDIPVIRPQGTLSQMKEENFNKWKLVVDELKTLGRDTKEGEEERELLNIINQGDPNKIVDYIHSKREIAERFILIYPSLSFLMSQVSPYSTIHPLLFELKPNFPLPPPFVGNSSSEIIRIHRQWLKKGYKEHILFSISKGLSKSILWSLASEDDDRITMETFLPYLNPRIEHFLRAIIYKKKNAIKVLAPLFVPQWINYKYKIIQFILNLLYPYDRKKVDISFHGKNCKPEECVEDIIRTLYEVYYYGYAKDRVYNLLEFMINYDVFLPYFDNANAMALFLIETAYDYWELSDIIQLNKKIKSYL